MHVTGRAMLITAGAAVTGIALDRALKGAVEARLDEGERAQGPIGTSIVRRTNHAGIGHTDPDSRAHGALVAAGGVLAAGIAGAGIVLGRSPLVSAGAGLVAGGMASNLVDRAAGTGVTDFLPTPLGLVNGADIAIGAGVVLAGIGLVLR